MISFDMAPVVCCNYLFSHFTDYFNVPVLLAEDTANTLRVLLVALEKRGEEGAISFTDPDAVIVIETVGPQAGMTLFTREQLTDYPFLHVD